MTEGQTFYEAAQDLGEVVSNGLRYRVFYDAERHCTIRALIPGQDQLIGSTIPADERNRRQQ